MDYEYDDMPSNEQRLDYLDNPNRAFTPVKDFNYRVHHERKKNEQKIAARLLSGASEEDEVQEQ